MNKIDINVLNNSKYYWPGKNHLIRTAGEEKHALGQDPAGILPVPGKEAKMSWYKGVRVGFFFLEEVSISRVVSPRREAARGRQAVRRDRELGSLVLRALIASVCSPYGLPRPAPAGRGMLLLAQRSWQPGGIAGKQSGHLTSRVLPL